MVYTSHNARGRLQSVRVFGRSISISICNWQKKRPSMLAILIQTFQFQGQPQAPAAAFSCNKRPVTDTGSLLKNIDIIIILIVTVLCWRAWMPNR